MGYIEKKEKSQEQKQKLIQVFKREWTPAIAVLVCSIVMPFVSQLFTDDLSQKEKILYIILAISAYLIIALLCAAITAICNARKGSEDLITKFGDLEKSLSENISIEKSMITNLYLADYVLDKNKVISLEASVSKNCEIYIQSSRFELEKGPLEDTIIWNFRKGIKYIYLIPEGESYKKDYIRMLQDWYKLYSNFLISKEEFDKEQNELNQSEKKKYKTLWDKRYQELYEEAANIWKKKMPEEARKTAINNCKRKCENLFKNLVKTHVDDASEFFVTVAVYEVSRNKWEAIIKLPTQEKYGEYFAFKIPSINPKEKEDFLRDFKDRYKSKLFNRDDIASYGGIYEIDFNVIFNR